jgi:predicted ATPase/DNA-binding winged helix-turn-helix (wHTH) protein
MTRAYRFRAFEVLPTGRRVSKNGEPMRLGARAFDVLVALIERRGRVVSRDELLELAWPGVVVEENNLEVQVHALRRQVGRDAIVTVPGRGYQFVAEVDAGSVDPPVAAAIASAVPAARTPLFGRAVDIAELRARLRDDCVVTLTGSGGVGKTSLARALTLACDDIPGDRAWVDLSLISSAQMVPGAVARELRIPFLSPPSPGDLAATLRHRTGLFVLDNCEHLLEAASALVDTLREAAPGLKIVVTSQEPLRVQSEFVHRVGPLALPPPGPFDRESIEASPAVQLFTARARAAGADVELNDRNAALIAEICARLDGIPLALELAAGRLPLLGVDCLAERLADRFRLLTQGARLAPPRQKTLQAAFEWSHAMLSLAEQAVFRRLGVFAGSFTLEAAQQVAGDGQIDEWEVLEALGGLVDKSLVVKEVGPVPRYRLLETARLFAAGKLDDAGEAAPCRRSHALATLAHLVRQDQQGWNTNSELQLAELEPEMPNLRAALAWAQSPQGDPLLGLALAASSGWMWEIVGLLGEGAAHLRTFEPALDAALPRTRLGYCLALSRLLPRTGLPMVPRDLGERTLALARAHAPERLYEALTTSAWFYVRTGQLEKSLHTLRELAAIDDRAVPPRLRAYRHRVEAEACGADGNIAAARTACEKRRVQARLAGEKTIAVMAEAELAKLDLVQGDIDQAIEALNTARRNAILWHTRMWIQHYLCCALSLKGCLREARAAFMELRPMRQAHGSAWLMLEPLALWWARRGDLERAQELLSCAAALYRRRSRSGSGLLEDRVRAQARQIVTQGLSVEKQLALGAQGEAMDENQTLARAYDFDDAGEADQG